MKKSTRQCEIAAIIAVTLLSLVAGKPGGASADTEIGWDGGSYIRNDDLGYYVQFGGRVFSDASWVSADDGLRDVFPEITDGAEIRSARFAARGVVHHVVDFKLQLEFAGQFVGFRDAYLGLSSVPVVGTVRIGHQKEMFGLEQLMSLKRISFVERSLTAALAPGRNLGFGAGRTAADGKVTITGGVFRNSAGVSSYRGNRYNGTFRFTVAPVMDAGAGKVLHVGAAGSIRQAEPDPEDGETKLRYAVYPESNLSPQMLDTGYFEADAAVHTGLEFAAIWQNASILGEYMRVGTDAAQNGDPAFWGMYVITSYFLTGEHRGYRGGVVQGIRPNSVFDGRGGSGAWELALRYSSVNLNDGAVQGGEERNITAAVNWYISTDTRVMLNYTYADLVDVGTAHQINARFQVVF